MQIATNFYYGDYVYNTTTLTTTLRHRTTTTASTIAFYRELQLVLDGVTARTDVRADDGLVRLPATIGDVYGVSLRIGLVELMFTFDTGGYFEYG